jgi:N-acetylglutamate synthase
MPSVLRADWVGRRVVVRRVAGHNETGRVRFGDVVGDLLELTAVDALLDARTGPVRVPLAQIAVARLARPSTADVLELERVCALGWRADETAEIEGWLLRADSGFTGRANSAMPLNRPPESLERTLAAARAWYAARGLPLRVQSPLPARALLDAELNERGWPADPDVHVFAARLDVLLARTTPQPRTTALARAAPLARAAQPAADIEITSAPDVDWLAAYHYRGRGALPESARGLLLRHDRVGFAAARLAGRPVAIARGAVDDGWLGVTAVEVSSQHRRRGLARAIAHELWRWARDEHGATRSYLQVEHTNQPAIGLYLGLGYWHHHDYRYRTEPDCRRGQALTAETGGAALG